MPDALDQTGIAETERLVIRPWRPDEADRLFDTRCRDEVARWLGTPTPMREREEAVRQIVSWAEQIADDSPIGTWAAVPRDSGVPAGSVMLVPLPDGAGEVQIGWYLHPDSWGRGLATEAAAAVLAYGLRSGLDEIWAVTHMDNVASLAVCRRIGMRLLGVTDRWYGAPSPMLWIGARDGQRPSLAPDDALASLLGAEARAAATGITSA